MELAPRTKRIKELDGLRAISVLLVVAYHLLNWAHIFGVPGPWAENAIAYGGKTGVDVFFVISGFIITTLMIEEHQATGEVSLFRFYIKRIFRIIPPYLCYILVICALGQAGFIDLSDLTLFRDIFFLSNIFPEHNWFLAHSWTLSVEEQYYLFFPFVLWKLLQGNLRLAGIVLAGFYLFSFCSLKIATLLFHGVPPLGINLGWLYPFRYIVSGVLLAINWPAIDRFASRQNGLLPLACLAWFFIGGCHPGGLTLGPLFDAIEPFVIALLIAWVICHAGACSLLRSFPMQSIGKWSYSIYLWQQLFAAPSTRYLGIKFSTFPVSLLLILLISALSYHLIERNFIALGRRVLAKLDGRKHPSPADPKLPPLS